ncbi:hypothetical protein OROHE_013348 [Orobanche hederae]
MIIRKKVSGGVKLDDAGVNRLVDQWKLSQGKGADKGTWISLKNALIHAEDKMAKTIINNTSIFVIRADLSVSVGYEGIC